MSNEMDDELPSHLSSLALLAGATLGLAAVWWLRQNLMPPDIAPAPVPAPGPAKSPASRPTTQPVQQQQQDAAQADPKRHANDDQPSEDDQPSDDAKPNEAASPSAETARTASSAAGTTAETAGAAPDDLTRIEGIGPKIAQVLAAAGITTWALLAACTAEQLRELLIEANPRYRMFNPDTWPQQAELAAGERFEELAILQDELKSGRRS